ncbi:MAG: hypothetical protein VKK04_25055 [Synechococcales bacterium]|nr:hypothetical protein [Synechococcales bacterium]
MKTTGYWGNSTLRSPITDPIWSRVSFKPLAAQIHRLWDALLTTMTASEELQVWQTQRRDGTARWHVYDPMDGRRLQFASEGEVRQWLEERYYVR